MLKQRIITALILGSLVIAGVLWLPLGGFALLVSVLLLAGAWEWGGLLRLTVPVGRLIYLLLLLAVALPLWLGHSNQVLVWLVLLLSAGFWLAVLVALVLYQQQRLPSLPALAWELLGFVVLLPACLALVVLHQKVGLGAVLFALSLAWVADTAAYFGGRRYGRIKLASRISPGKTREGAYAALAGGLVWGLLGVLWLKPSHGLGFLLLCVIVVVFSIAGDLFESLIKRERGVKDSGSVLPGHGGVLDRIDSLTAALPLFTLGWLVLS